MKTIYHFIAPLLVLIAMTACAELEVSENPQNSNNELLQELSVTGKDFIFDGETRSTVTIGESGASFTWDVDDVIGIFPDKGDQVSFAMDEGAGTQTATFSGGGWALKSSAKYAAYYPHVYENRDLTAIPVSYVGQTQNGNGNTDHIGAYDFMAAGVSTPENGAVAFDMQHLGALVQLTITVPEPSTLTKVVLTSSTDFTETGTIDLTSEIPAITAETQSNTLEIVLNDVVTTEANEKVIVYFMTAPVDLTNSELTATTYYADETNSEIDLTKKNLQSGKAYRFTEDVKSLNDYIDEYGINHGEGVEIDGVIWAPVNCGYHKTDYRYGKLYQWGRKYGQGYSDDDLKYPSSEEIVLGGVSLLDGQLKINEDLFYKGSDWVFQYNNSLWNYGTEEEPIKTEYDPCPEGWRVPTKSETENLILNFSSWNYSRGYTFCGQNTYSPGISGLALPSAGDRSSDGNAYLISRNNEGHYWTSYSNELNASELEFNKDQVFIYNYNPKASGCAVRCVKDCHELVVVSSISLDKTSVELVIRESIDLEASILPANSNHRIAFWQSDDPDIATVDQNGHVTAISLGSTQITAIAGMNKAICSITVKDGVATNIQDYFDEYDINHGPGTEIDGVIWAPVNCGYHKTDFPWGKLYQWGRKFGQGYMDNKYADGSYPTIDNSTILFGGTSLSNAQSESNQSKFYLGDSSNDYDWLTKGNSSTVLWNTGTEEEPVKNQENDPCPNGWRVPTYEELKSLQKNYSQWLTNDLNHGGIWFSGSNAYTVNASQIFLDAAGQHTGSSGLSTSEGTYSDRNNTGRYWSSYSPFDSRASSLLFYNIYGSFSISMNTQYKSNGYSVRCVHE